MQKNVTSIYDIMQSEYCDDGNTKEREHLPQAHLHLPGLIDLFTQVTIGVQRMHFAAQKQHEITKLKIQLHIIMYRLCVILLTCGVL